MIRDIKPVIASELIENSESDSSLEIIDVRTKKEYASGKIKGSINMDVRSPSFKDDVNRLDKSRKYLVYCRTGVRSKKAQQIMKNLGFLDVNNLEGGIIQWVKEGFPTSK